MKLFIEILIYIIYIIYEFLIKPVIFISKIPFRLFIKIDYDNIIGIEYYNLCLPDCKNYLLTSNSKIKSNCSNIIKVTPKQFNYLIKRMKKNKILELQKSITNYQFNFYTFGDMFYTSDFTFGNKKIIVYYKNDKMVTVDIKRHYKKIDKYIQELEVYNGNN